MTADTRPTRLFIGCGNMEAAIIGVCHKRGLSASIPISTARAACFPRAIRWSCTPILQGFPVLRPIW